MRLTVFGATGGVGREVVRIAGERGHQVTAVVRGNSAAGVRAVQRVVMAPVLNPASAEVDAVRERLRELLMGSDVVISCLGLRRRNPANPWSPIVGSERFTSESIGHLVWAAEAAGVRRLIAVSAAGVGDSWSVVSKPVKMLFRSSKIGVAYDDLNRMEAVLRESPLDWCAVRPVTLSDRGKGRTVQPGAIVERYGLFSQIGRAEVAALMVDRAAAEVESLADLPGGRTPMIASTK